MKRLALVAELNFVRRTILRLLITIHSRVHDLGREGSWTLVINTIDILAREAVVQDWILDRCNSTDLVLERLLPA